MSGFILGGIGAMLLGLVLITSGGSTIKSVLDDKTAVTYMAAMGMRNAIIELSLSDRGTAMYETPDSKQYTFTIDADKITALYGGAESKGRPIVSINSYTPELKSGSPPIGNKFCLVVKRDRDDNCKKVVEVCVPDATCCAIDNSACW